MEALLFHLDGRRCAIPLARVVEVLPAVRAEQLPDAPRGIEGVVNVRGEIVAILALRERLGLEEREIEPSEYFVLAAASARRLILRSDRFPEIAELPDVVFSGSDQLDRAMATVVPLPDGVVLLQDLDALLTSEHDAEIRAALERAGVSA